MTKTANLTVKRGAEVVILIVMKPIMLRYSSVSNCRLLKTNRDTLSAPRAVEAALFSTK